MENHKKKRTLAALLKKMIYRAALCAAAIVCALWLLISIPSVNKHIVRFVISAATRSSRTTLDIEIGSLSLDIFGMVSAKDVLVYDKENKDTLIYAKRANIDIDKSALFFSFSLRPKKVSIADARIKLGSGLWKEEDSSANGFNIGEVIPLSLQSLALSRIRVYVDHPLARAEVGIWEGTLEFNKKRNLPHETLFTKIYINSPRADVFRYGKKDDANKDSASTPVIVSNSPSMSVDGIRALLLDRFSSLENIYIKTNILIKNLSCEDHTALRLIDIKGMRIENKVHPKKEEWLVKGEWKENPLLVRLSRYDRNCVFDFSLGRDAALKGSYRFDSSFRKSLRLRIENAFVSAPALRIFPLSWVKKLPIKRFGGLGYIYASSDSLYVSLASNKLADADYAAQGRYSKKTRKIIIDNFSASPREEVVENIQPYLVELYGLQKFPYRVDGFRKINLKGSLEKDSLFYADVYLDSLSLRSRDSALPRLSMYGISLLARKDHSTRDEWSIRGTSDHVGVGESDFSDLSFLYRLQGAYIDSLLLSARHKADRRLAFSVFLSSPNRITSDTSSTHIAVDASLDGIRMNSFYAMPNESLRNTILSTKLKAEILREKDFLSIKGSSAGRSSLYDIESKDSLAMDRLDFDIRHTDKEDLLSLAIDKDKYAIRLKEMSIEKVIDRVIYQYKSLLQDSSLNRKMANDKTDGELCEISVDAQDLDRMVRYVWRRPIKTGHINGRMYASGNDFSFYVKTPKLSYDGNRISKLDVKYEANNERVNLRALADSVYMDTMQLAHTTNINISSDNKRDIYLQLSTGLLRDKNVRMSCALKDFGNGVSYLEMTDFKTVIDGGGEWTLQPQEQENTRYSRSPKKFVISNKSQKITCLPLFYRKEEFLNVSLDVENMDISFLNPLVFEPGFHGEALAFVHIKIDHYIFNPHISLYGELKQLKFNSVYLGDFDVYETFKENKMKLSLYSKEKDKLSLRSLFQFGEGSNYDLAINIKRLPIEWANYYLNPNVSRITGIGDGSVTVHHTDDPESLSINGQAVVNGSCLINYTNCSYKLKNVAIDFNDDKIELRSAKVRDMKKKEGYGILDLALKQTSSFDKIDLRVNVSAHDLHVYNNSIADYDNYFLSAYGTGDFSFRMREKAIDLSGKMRTEDSSLFIVRPTPKQKLANPFDDGRISIGHIYENKADTLLRKSVADARDADEDTINFKADIEANDKLSVLFYTDDRDEGFINLRGNGDISMAYQTAKGEAEIEGDYIISEMPPVNMGYLTVNLSTEKQSRIRFDGNLDPRLDVYTHSFIKNVDFSSIYKTIGSAAENIVSSTNSNTFSSYRSDINLLIRVGGSALSPKIEFDIDLPSTSPLVGSQNMRLFLNRFRSDPLFADKQMGYLMVFKQFIGDNADAQFSLASNAALAGVLSSVSTYILDKAGKDIIQKTIDKLLPNQNIYFNINSNFGSSSSNTTSTAGSAATIDKGNISLSLSKAFLSDRLTLSLGGSFDYVGNPTASAQNLNNAQFYASPSIDARWRVSKQSNIYVGMYYRNAVNYEDRYLGQQSSSNIAGINISVSKEFNSFKELFSKKKPPLSDSAPPASDSSSLPLR